MEKSLSAHDSIAGLEVLKVIKISCSDRVGNPYSAVIILVGILMTLYRLLVDELLPFFTFTIKWMRMVGIVLLILEP